MLTSKRFAPLFWTQFFGAFNDNLFKTCLVILITFKLAPEKVGADPAFLVTASAGLFILPFMLFSSGAGLLADYFEKSHLVRYIKVLEIVLMTLAGIGFYLESVPMLMAILFMMGFQSTLFGPLKYSLLPLLLKTDELVSGNSLISSATFVAIILGTILGSFYQNFPAAEITISVLMIMFAAVGWVAALFIPECPPERKPEKISFIDIWFLSVFRTMAIATGKRQILKTVLLVSSFWFFGASILSQLPTFTKLTIQGDESVYILFLIVFTLGISVGAIFCSKFVKTPTMKFAIPSGIVITLCSVLIYFLTTLTDSVPGNVMGITDFTESFANIIVLFTFFFMAIAGAFYVIPVFALMQEKGDKNEKARTIGANNLFNALFMVGSAVIIGILNLLGVSLAMILMIVGFILAGFTVAVCIPWRGDRR